MTLQVGDQFLQLGHRLIVDAVANAGPVDLALDQASFFENLQMLGHRRLSERHFLDDFTAHAGSSA